MRSICNLDCYWSYIALDIFVVLGICVQVVDTFYWLDIGQGGQSRTDIMLNTHANKCNQTPQPDSTPGPPPPPPPSRSWSSGTNYNQYCIRFATLSVFQLQPLTDLLANLSPPAHPACRESFLFRIEKMQYLLNRSSNFRSVCTRLFKKMCLTKWDPTWLYLTNFFFEYVIATSLYYELPSWLQHNCNLTVAYLAHCSTLTFFIGAQPAHSYTMCDECIWSGWGNWDWWFPRLTDTSWDWTWALSWLPWSQASLYLIISLSDLCCCNL